MTTALKALEGSHRVSILAMKRTFDRHVGVLEKHVQEDFREAREKILLKYSSCDDLWQHFVPMSCLAFAQRSIPIVNECPRQQANRSAITEQNIGRRKRSEQLRILLQRMGGLCLN